MIRKLKTHFSIDITNTFVAPCNKVSCPNPDPDVTARMMGASEVVEYSRNPIYEFSTNVAKAMENEGKFVCGTFKGDTLTSYNCFATGTVEPHYNSSGAGYGGIGLKMPPNVVYCFKGFCLPEHRGKNHVGMTIEKGVHTSVDPDGWAIGTIHHKNASSIRMLTKIGFVKQDTLKEFKIFKYFYYSMTDFVQLGEVGAAGSKQAKLFVSD